MTVTLANDLSLAEIADVFGAQSWSFGVGTVPEFTVPAVDLDRVLSRRGLLRDGMVLVNDGHRWEIAATEREYRGENVWLTFTARSQFARRLRNMTGPDRQKGVTPAEWITSKAKKAGGSALVEPGAKQRLIVQGKNEPVLAVVESLAADTSVSWCFDGNRLLVGTPWWAFQGGPGLPVWPCSMSGARFKLSEWLNPLSLTTRSSIDDRGQAATATLTVESSSGWKVRPWHRVDISGADAADNGMWLVTGATRDEGEPDTTIELSRPLKSAPKDGSSGKPASSDASGSLGDGGTWIANADKVYSGCSRSPRAYVAMAMAAKGSGYAPNHCAQWVGDMTGARVGNAWAYYVRSKGPKAKDPNPPRGSIIVWKPTGPGDGSPEWSGAGHGSIWGHVGIALGDGSFISATGGSVVVQSIASWGVGDGYYGACAPNY